MTFDPSLPLESAWTLPSKLYVDEAVYRHEMETIFRTSWTPVARKSQVERSGRYVAAEVADVPLFVVRDKKGKLRAFHNVCRHHAAALVSGEGVAEDSFVCPYHAWTYDLDGALLRTPHCGALHDFDREQFGLKSMPVMTWGPWVWVNPDPDARSFVMEVSKLEHRLEKSLWEGLRFVKRVEYDLNCNWKVFVDNYLDGGYHVAHVHPGLTGQLDLSSYHTEVFSLGSIQSCRSGQDNEDESQDFKERLGEGATYGFLYPHVMINRYGPVLDVNILLPLSVDRTRVVFEYYFDVSVRDDEDFVTRSLEASHQVQLEDMAICDSVQKGLRSPAYDVGRYAPAREAAMYEFHRYIWNKVQDV